MKKLLVTIIGILIVLIGYGLSAAQSGSDYNQPNRIQIESMEKLSQWIGVWEGSGWSFTDANQRSGFVIYETVEPRLQGQVLLIEGRGISKSDNQLIHEALGLLSFEPGKEVYNFRGYDLRGKVIDTEFHIEEDHFRWGFRDEESGVLLRFTITITEDHWHETGEISPDNGTNWFKILDMNLTKIE